jgi:hypothetical protein
MLKMRNIIMSAILSILILGCSDFGEFYADAKSGKSGTDTTSGGTTGTTTPVPVFYIYTNSVAVSGMLGSRALSTSTCATMQTTTYPALTCTSHLAVVSYSGDALSTAAANYAIPAGRQLTSVSGVPVSTDWNSFVVSAPLTSLQTAGVATSTPTPFYWTSTGTSGTYNATFNCTNNTIGTAGTFGAQGAITSTATSHLSFAVNQPCDGSVNSAYLMCICWN